MTRLAPYMLPTHLPGLKEHRNAAQSTQPGNVWNSLQEAPLPADFHVLSFPGCLICILSVLTFKPPIPQILGHMPYNNSLPRALPALS